MSEDTDERLARIEADIAEIKSALRGAFGGPGMVAQVGELQARVARLEAERSYARGMAAAVAAIASVVISVALDLLMA